MWTLATKPHTYPAYLLDYDSSFIPQYIRYALAYFGTNASAAGSEYSYCELGMGAGLHTIGLACLNPQITVWGVEYSPQSILTASRLLQECELPNCVLAPVSFEQFVDADSPQFDCIVFRERFTGISVKERKQVLEIVSRKLKCGGVFVISYEAMPVGAKFIVLVQVLRELWNCASGSSESRLAQALEQLKFLHRCGQGVFWNDKQMSEYCQMLLQMDRRQLLHRYLTPHYSPVWFRELAEPLADAGIVFSGSLDYHMRSSALTFSEEAQEILAKANDGYAQELLRDCLASPVWRRDIFSKGQQVLPPQLAQDIILTTPIRLVTPSEYWAEQLHTPRGEMKLAMELHRPVLEIMQKEGALTVLQIFEKLQQSGEAQSPTLAEVAEVCAVRLALNECVVVTGETTASHRAQIRSSLLRYNRHVLQQSVVLNSFVTLIGVDGVTFSIDPVSALFCIARLEEQPDPLATAISFIEEQIKELGDSESLQEDVVAERKLVVARQYEKFVNETTAAFQSLDIPLW